MRRLRELASRLGLTAAPAWALAALAAVAAAGAWREAALVALPEELLFRGLLQGELVRRTSRPWAAAALSALAFAVAHVVSDGGRLAGLLTFIPGLLFAALRQLSGSIWPAVAAHAVANLLWLATPARA